MIASARLDLLADYLSMQLARIDSRTTPPVAIAQTLRRVAVGGVALLSLRNGLAAGQLPGAPVLQNAWASPGIVAAVDLAGGSDGSTYAAAASWAPASGRFQFSGGVGIRSRTGGGSGGVYGARLAMPFGGASSAIGFGAFAGVGGGATPTSTSTDSVPNTSVIPVGVALGWRHAIGPTRGISVYTSPAYVYFSGGSKSGGLVRVAAGVDVGVTHALGITGGVEFGQARPRGVGGPSGSTYGLGLSYALGRR
jgi:hypothetical protein